LAIADQIIVSGASFAATLLVGRTNSAALGEYSIAISIVALVLAIQNALVLLPFTIRQHRTDSEESVDLADALALSMLLSGAAMALCFAGALILALTKAETTFTALTVMLAAVMPFVVLREFARRYALAQLRMRVVLALDVAAASLQIATLGALALSDAMNAVTACAALGLSCVAPALVWRVAPRKNFGWRLHRIPAERCAQLDARQMADPRAAHRSGAELCRLLVGDLHRRRRDDRCLRRLRERHLCKSGGLRRLQRAHAETGASLAARRRGRSAARSAEECAAARCSRRDLLGDRCDGRRKRDAPPLPRR
jgi:hypothetical protein